MTLKNDAKFEEELSLGSKNDMDEFYDASSGKSENFHFDRLLLWKVCNLWVKKIYRGCVVKDVLWFQKWHKWYGEFSLN